MVNLSRIPIFRMVHIDNISHILQYGLTHWSSPNCNPNYIPIGDNSLINTRNQTIIRNGEILGQYLPFYFWGRMPMLYVIQKGHNEVQTVEAENIVYCISFIQNIIDIPLEYLFTDGHATSYLTSFYDANDVQNIENIIDFNAIKSRYWNEYPDQKRKKSAEFLAKGDIPIDKIIAFAVYNQTAKDKLIKMGINSNIIHIRKNEYYF